MVGLVLLAAAFVYVTVFGLTAVCEVYIEGRPRQGIPRRMLELLVELWRGAFGKSTP